MGRKLGAIAVLLGLASSANAQQLPPMPQLGERLRVAVEWCQTVGAKIDKQQDTGFIFIGCHVDRETTYTFGGTETSGYRIETSGAVFLAPYQELQDWDGPFFCRPAFDNAKCQSFTRRGNGVKSHALVYFNTERDRHAIWRFNHSIDRD